ncbi:oligosaccharide repeat unit polymerase [Yoonia maricola]|uniref:Oligosaccharide repeat unit polymerase n=1 Tax=Yoonia maricola TaxID=420999 RepID=A0A2M8W2G2_9RHOB|nr:oligosaccharide repeat unit polymerase [Yoonia maricola]PJI85113.1 oligosaccharide repeat unit polymerase [Yoonia maricola]
MENLLIVALALVCTVIPFWMGGRYGLLHLVSPMHFLGYFCAFGFLVKVAVYGGRPEYAFYSRYIDTPGAMQIGAIYLAGFILLMCLGYRCAVRPFDPPPAISEARIVAGGLIGQGWLFAGAFAVAGLTFALLLQARGISLFSADLLTAFNADKQINVNSDGVGATLAGIKTLFVVPKFAFVLLLAQGLVQRARWLLVQAFVLAMLLVGIALISGDRFELVELLVFGSITYLMLGGRIGWRSLICMTAAAGLVLWLSAYMTALRGTDAGLLHQIVGSTYFLDINAAVMVTDQVKPVSYLWGETYGWWTFGWVPRAIWVDKPAIDLGVFLKRDVMQVATGGAFNVTGPGEAFMNFGWAGSFVGFALGWVYRRAEVLLLSARSGLRHGSFYLYPLTLYPFVQATLHSSFSGFIVGAVAQLVLIFAMIAVFVPRYRSHQMTRFRSTEVAHV